MKTNGLQIAWFCLACCSPPPGRQHVSNIDSIEVHISMLFLVSMQYWATCRSSGAPVFSLQHRPARWMTWSVRDSAIRFTLQSKNECRPPRTSSRKLQHLFTITTWYSRTFFGDAENAGRENIGPENAGLRVMLAMLRTKQSAVLRWSLTFRYTDCPVLCGIPTFVNPVLILYCPAFSTSDVWCFFLWYFIFYSLICLGPSFSVNTVLYVARTQSL